MPGAGPASPPMQEGGRLFLNAYFVATGLHAVHLLIGIALVLGLWLLVLWRRVPLPRGHNTVELTGLYWHLVDIVWVFLYPILYLINR